MSSSEVRGMAADPVAEMRERARELCSCLGLTRLRDGDWVVDEEVVDRMVEFAQSELRRLGASVDVAGLIDAVTRVMPEHQHVSGYCHWCECKKAIAEAEQEESNG